MIAVVPLAGTWIETGIYVKARCYLVSFPLRERGLKHERNLESIRCCKSFPLRERGLKPEGGNMNE